MSNHARAIIPEPGASGGAAPSADGAVVSPGAPGAPPIKVSVVDDDPNIGELVGKKLRRQPEFLFLANYPTAEALFRQLPAQIPDVLMVDIILPGASGIEVVHWVSRQFPAVRMIVLSGSDDSNHVVQALEAGARGYLLKPLVLATLPGILHDIAAGEAVLAPQISGFLVNYFNRKGLVGDALRQLTSREREIVAGWSAGVSDKASADQLHITLSTYNNHLQHIYKKLAVSSKREAIEKLKGSRN